MMGQNGSGSHAIGGYDAVSYFDEGRPLKGDTAHGVEHDGMTWLFANDRNAQAFAASPAKYVPAYDGRCAFATSLGKTETGSPSHWAIREGRLFLNSNAIAHLLWKAIPGRIAAADRRWRHSDS